MIQQDLPAAGSSLRLIGLDVGDRRIGVAVSDPTGFLATPVEVYTRRTEEEDIRYLANVAHEHEAQGFVVGLPRNMNGSEGPQAEKTRAFADVLAGQGFAVSLWDERLSTVEVERRRDEQGRRRRSPYQRIDDEVAALILQSYLDSVRIRRAR